MRANTLTDATDKARTQPGSAAILARRSAGDRWRALCEFGVRLAKLDDAPQLFRSVAEFLPTIVPCARTSVSLLAEDKSYLELHALCGRQGAIPVGRRFGSTNSMLGNTARLGRLLAHTDLTEKNYDDGRDLLAMGLRSSMDVPLFAQGSVVGTLNTAAICIDHYSEDDRQLLRQCGRLLESHLERCREFERLRSQLSGHELAAHTQLERVREFSHDIRSPLTSLVGFSELLAHDPNLDDEQLEAVTAMNRSSRHLMRISHDILASLQATNTQPTAGESRTQAIQTCAARPSVNTRGTSSGATTRPPSATARPRGHDEAVQNAEIPQLLADLNAIFANAQHDLGTVLRFHPSPELPHQLPLCRRKLTQILVNLVENAIKYSEAATTPAESKLPQVEVKLDLERSNPRTCKASRSTLDAHLYIEVADRGPGIPKERLESIFERGIRAPETAEQTCGSGLGLHIVRNYVRELGGEVRCRSKVGEGSTFIVTLPLLRETSLENY